MLNLRFSDLEEGQKLSLVQHPGRFGYQQHGAGTAFAGGCLPGLASAGGNIEQPGSDRVGFEERIVGGGNGNVQDKASVGSLVGM